MPSITDYEVPQLIRIYKSKKKGEIITEEIATAMDACVASHVAEGNTEDEAVKACMIEVRKQHSAMKDNQNASDKINEVLKGRHLRTAVDLMLIADDSQSGLPKKIQVMPAGDFMTVPYGPMVIDANVFNQMKMNFDMNTRKAVPIDVDHDGGKAAGWIKNLEPQADGLYAEVEWTPYGSDLVKNKEYALISPEWAFDYVDPEFSTHHGAVLVAASLTNRPLFKEMDVLTASDGGHKDLTKENPVVILLAKEQKNMPNFVAADLIEKGLKDPASLTKEERKFLRANASGLTAEKIVTLGINVMRADETEEDLKVESNNTEPEKPAAPAEPETPAEPVVPAQTEEERAKAEADLKAQQDADAKAKADAEAAKTPEERQAEADAKAKADADAEAAKTANDGGDKDVTIKASELAEYKKYQEQVRRTATEKEVATFVASETGGKVYPKSKDLLVNFVLTCSDVQKTALFDLLKTLPELKIAGERGQSNGTPLTAKDQLDKLVDERLKAQDSEKVAHPFNRAEMIKKVLEENSALAKAYDAELKSN